MCLTAITVAYLRLLLQWICGGSVVRLSFAVFKGEANCRLIERSEGFQWSFRFKGMVSRLRAFDFIVYETIKSELLAAEIKGSFVSLPRNLNNKNSVCNASRKSVKSRNRDRGGGGAGRAPLFCLGWYFRDLDCWQLVCPQTIYFVLSSSRSQA
jgi:hypothetical protein